MKVEEIAGCRICGCKQFIDQFDLGEIYPSNFITDSSEEYDKAPLNLVRCIKCHLVQLRHTVTPDSMYRQYWYKSNLNKSMVRDLKDIVENIEKRVELAEGDIVIDIGCNDGTLFKQYKNPRLIKLGFDPARNLKEEAEKNCTVFYNEYFSSYPLKHKAKVITSIAMFYDLPYPNVFVKDVKLSLDPKGIWVIQMTDLVSMLMLNAFDNICHEHLEYYSLHVLDALIHTHGLEIFDVEWNAVNGGSLRAYISFPGSYPVSENVEHALMKEFVILCHDVGSFEAFSTRYSIIKDKIVKFLTRCKENKDLVIGLGASTKGNTLLQKYGIGTDLLPYICEVNRSKNGRKTIGTEIPIILEEDALKMYPEYLFVLPWHFLNDLLDKNISFLRDYGGRFVVPLPIPAIIYYKDGETVVENL